MSLEMRYENRNRRCVFNVYCAREGVISKAKEFINGRFQAKNIDLAV